MYTSVQTSHQIHATNSVHSQKDQNSVETQSSQSCWISASWCFISQALTNTKRAQCMNAMSFNSFSSRTVTQNSRRHSPAPLNTVTHTHECTSEHKTSWCREILLVWRVQSLEHYVESTLRPLLDNARAPLCFLKRKRGEKTNINGGQLTFQSIETDRLTDRRFSHGGIAVFFSPEWTKSGDRVVPHSTVLTEYNVYYSVMGWNCTANSCGQTYSSCWNLCHVMIVLFFFFFFAAEEVSKI